MHYNPFAYLRSEKDILKLVQIIIANTKGEGEKAGEDFWVKAKKLYYTALIGYIFYEAPREEKKDPTHFAVKQYRKYKLAAGAIELRRTLHHYLSERCFA